MRKLVVLTFLSLDGVMQAPGGKGEDPSGGFEFEGWSVPYFDDVVGQTMEQQMGQAFDLLLGKKPTKSLLRTGRNRVTTTLSIQPKNMSLLMSR